MFLYQLLEKLVTNAVLSLSKVITNFITSKISSRHEYYLISKQYNRRLWKIYNDVKILGRSKPLPLNKIYVNLNVYEEVTERQSKSIQLLVEEFNRNEYTFNIKRQSKTGLQIVNEKSKLIILGKPGAGKTTFLKSILQQSIDGKLESIKTPIFINLNEYSISSNSLFDYVVAQFELSGYEYKYAEEVVRKLLVGGNCLILLDGLDEIKEEKEELIINEIKQFSRKYFDNQFIITCRVAAYKQYFENFTDVEIADFNNKQIKMFIRNWFYNNRHSFNNCWREINSNKSIMELASIPILLNLICMIYEEKNIFPINKVALYSEGLEILLNKWDESKNVIREENYKYFSISLKEKIFCSIAAKKYKENEFFFLKDDLLNDIKVLLKDQSSFNNNITLTDCEDILNSIEVQHGIFIKRAKKVYSFSHLTFQEFYAAKYLSENEDIKSLKQLITSKCLDIKWRELIILLTGFSQEPMEILQIISLEIRNYKEKQGFSDIIEIIDFATLRNETNASSFNKLLALFYLLYYTIDCIKLRTSIIDHCHVILDTIKLMCLVNDTLKYEYGDILRVQIKPFYNYLQYLNSHSSTTINHDNKFNYSIGDDLGQLIDRTVNINKIYNELNRDRILNSALIGYSSISTYLKLYYFFIECSLSSDKILKSTIINIIDNVFNRSE